MKQRYLTILAITLAACGVATLLHFLRNSSTIIIEGRIVAARNTVIYLERHNGVKLNAIDTLELPPRGDFRFKIESAPADPTLYELSCGDEKIPLLAQGGDRITINTLGDIALNYTVDGSKESELLRTFYQSYLDQANELKMIASEYAAKQRRGEDTDELSIKYGAMYQEIKREQLRFIITNKSNIAAIYALMQYLPGDRHLINEVSDVIYQRTVMEAVEKSYPESEYLKLLRHMVESQEALYELINNSTSLNYPEIELNDQYGKKIALSSLDGNVILLDFWSAELSESNRSNAELKEIYKEYHDQDFEVYQVGIDNSKAHWIGAIQLQRLPWISVSDLLGGNSPTLRSYNITSLPANILISKRGVIVERDIFGEELREAIRREVEITPIEQKQEF